MKFLRLCLLLSLLLTAPSVWSQSSGGGPVIENLTAEPATGDDGTSFRLVAAASHPQGSILTYTWNFGDGSPLRSGRTLNKIHHRYRNQGEFSVGLTVADSRGRSVERNLTITVKNVAPEIRKIVRVGGSSEGSPITFTSLVIDPGKDELTYRWDFGDGQTQEGTDKRNTEHIYQNPGTFLLSLVVDDGDGGTDRLTQTVIIGQGLEYTISGALGGGDQPDDNPYLTGVPVTPDGEFRPRLDFAKLLKGENAAKGSGFCAIGIGNRSGFLPLNGSAVRLSGAFPRGIEVGSYPIGAIREENQTIVEWPQSHLARPGLFFGTAEISTGTPDNPSTPDFESKGGSVEVTYYDGDRIEGTFSMSLLEIVQIIDPKDERYYPPRTISVSGSFAHAVNRNFLQGEFPDWYLCDPAENLTVESYTWSSPDSPSQQAFDTKTLVDYENPEIEIKLSDEYDLDSFFSGFKVEYRRQDGEYVEVPGFMMGMDDRTVKFIPLEDLKDGVIYRARIENGSDGIKGLRGETLEDEVEWEFETLLSFEDSLNGVTLSTYQVIQDAPLVPGKPTLTRVFVNWSEKPEVHSDSQTKRTLVEVSIKDGSGRALYSQAKTERVKRPDLYSDEEKKHARSSVNFFGWDPTGGESGPLIATVKQLPQPENNPKKFEGQTEITFYEASPQLIIDYFFVRVGSWQEGVPTDLRILGHKLARKGAEFTTQTFPVTQTTARNRGDLFVDEALISLPGKVSVYGPTSIELGIDWEIGRRIAEVADATGSDADLILAFLPRELQPSLAGYAYSSASRRTVAVFLHAAGESKSGNVNTVAHEFGHTFGLEHESTCPDGEIDSCILQGLSDPIEGFRIDLSGTYGWNKSRAEGNQQASRTPGSVISMMYPSALGDSGTFILPEHYKTLQSALKSFTKSVGVEERMVSPLHFASGVSPWTQFPELQSFLLAASGTLGSSQNRPGEELSSPFTEDQWIAQGVARRNGTEGLITQIAPTTERDLEVDSDGPFEIVVLDADARRLFSRSFHLPEKERYHPAPGSEEIAPFSIPVPANPATQKVVLNFQGRTLHEIARSTAEPSVRFSGQGGRLRVAGPIDLLWEGTDLNQDELVYSLYYSPDGSTWTPLILATSQTTFRLEPDQLQQGSAPQLMLLVTDGFNWGLADLPIVLESGLRVLYTTPSDGETLTSGDSITVTFNSPVDFEGLSEGAIRLTDPEGNPVEVERYPSHDGYSVSLRPRSQLITGSSYHLQIGDGSSMRLGRMAAEQQVSFTASGLDSESLNEMDGEASAEAETSSEEVPDSCGGIAGSTLKLLLPKTLDSIRVSSTDRGCRLTMTSRDSVETSRNFYESEILFNGFRMTENVTASGGERIRLGFSNPTLNGQVNIVKGAG
ncbi:MAG: PKD domain-containing protein, partial [Acidobacteriota bacterium]